MTQSFETDKTNEAIERKRMLLEMLETEPLTPREVRVLRMRYGLNEGDRVHTREEVGLAFGVSPDRIRMIEHKLFRHVCRRRRPIWD